MNASHQIPGLPRIVLIGGGLHATVVADCITASGQARVAGYVDVRSDETAPVRRLGVPYLGTDEQLEALVQGRTVSAGVLGLAGLEHARRRISMVARLDALMPAWWSSVHPAAVVAPSVELEPGMIILAGAIINPLARIGCHAVINTGAIVEHNTNVEDFAVISPRAVLCGNVYVGRGAFIGAGAVVITGVTIGAGAIVGAGAVVLRDVPDHATVVGNPARIVDTSTYPSPSDGSTMDVSVAVP